MKWVWGLVLIGAALWGGQELRSKGPDAFGGLLASWLAEPEPAPPARQAAPSAALPPAAAVPARPTAQEVLASQGRPAARRAASGSISGGAPGGDANRMNLPGYTRQKLSGAMDASERRAAGR